MLREYLARVRAFIDVYITGKGPRFLGEEIILE
jgi:vancomycin permeability regulator SanA